LTKHDSFLWELPPHGYVLLQKAGPRSSTSCFSHFFPLHSPFYISTLRFPFLILASPKRRRPIPLHRECRKYHSGMILPFFFHMPTIAIFFLQSFSERLSIPRLSPPSYRQSKLAYSGIRHITLFHVLRVHKKLSSPTKNLPHNSSLSLLPPLFVSRPVQPLPSPRPENLKLSPSWCSFRKHSGLQLRESSIDLRSYVFIHHRLLS